MKTRPRSQIQVQLWGEKYRTSHIARVYYIVQPRSGTRGAQTHQRAKRCRCHHNAADSGRERNRYVHRTRHTERSIDTSKRHMDVAGNGPHRAVRNALCRAVAHVATKETLICTSK